MKQYCIGILNGNGTPLPPVPNTETYSLAAAKRHLTKYRTWARRLGWNDAVVLEREVSEWTKRETDNDKNKEADVVTFNTEERGHRFDGL